MVGLKRDNGKSGGPLGDPGAFKLPLQGYSQNATWGLMGASPTGAPRPLHFTRLAPVCGVVVPDDFRGP